MCHGYFFFGAFLAADLAGAAFFVSVFFGAGLAAAFGSALAAGFASVLAGFSAFSGAAGASAFGASTLGASVFGASVFASLASALGAFFSAL